MARSDLQGQSGGSQINDFEFTVTDAWFGISPAFKEKTGLDTIFLHMVGQTDLDDRPVLTEEGFHPSYALSDDWEVTDDGKKVQYVGSGSKPTFGKWYGRLCDQVFEITADVADDPSQDPFYGDNHPSDASCWVGTRWFMQEKEYNFGQYGKSTHLMPIRYLGKVDVAASPVATAAPTAAAPTAAAPDASSNGAIREQVETLARSLPDYPTFQKAALAIPGVMADTQLVMEIADQTKLFDRVRS